MSRSSSFDFSELMSNLDRGLTVLHDFFFSNQPRKVAILQELRKEENRQTREIFLQNFLEKISQTSNPDLFLPSLFLLSEMGDEYLNLVNSRGENILHIAANFSKEGIFRTTLEFARNDLYRLLQEKTHEGRTVLDHIASRETGLPAAAAYDPRFAQLTEVLTKIVEYQLERIEVSPRSIAELANFLLASEVQRKEILHHNFTSQNKAFFVLLGKVVNSDFTYTDSVSIEEIYNLAWGKITIIEQAKFLLDCGFNPNFYYSQGDTPLHRAAREIELMNLFFESTTTSPPNIFAEDKIKGGTPFMRAVGSGKLKNVRYLVKHGSDVHEVSRKGKKGNALHRAIDINSSEIANYLINCNVNLEDDSFIWDLENQPDKTYSPLALAAHLLTIEDRSLFKDNYLRIIKNIGAKLIHDKCPDLLSFDDEGNIVHSDSDPDGHIFSTALAVITNFHQDRAESLKVALKGGYANPNPIRVAGQPDDNSMRINLLRMLSALNLPNEEIITSRGVKKTVYKYCKDKKYTAVTQFMKENSLFYDAGTAQDSPLAAATTASSRTSSRNSSQIVSQAASPGISQNPSPVRLVERMSPSRRSSAAASPEKRPFSFGSFSSFFRRGTHSARASAETLPPEPASLLRAHSLVDVERATNPRLAQLRSETPNPSTSSARRPRSASAGIPVVRFRDDVQQK